MLLACAYPSPKGILLNQIKTYDTVYCFENCFVKVLPELHLIDKR